MTIQATSTNIQHIIDNMWKASGTLHAAKFAASALHSDDGVVQTYIDVAQLQTRKASFHRHMSSAIDRLNRIAPDEAAATLRAECNPEAARELTDYDLKSMYRMTGGNLELCRIAVRNMQRSYPEDVHPLGYFMHRNGEICKIESTDQSDDGEVWNISVFDVGSRIYTELSNADRMVNWFMPEPAQEFDAQDVDIMTRDAVCMATTALTQRISPLDFGGMLDDVAGQYAVRKYMQKVWCDFGDAAIKAIKWEPKRYPSRQAALDSGDYDTYKSLAGSVLADDIARGLVVIGEAEQLIHGFARQTLECIARGELVPQDEKTIQDLARAVLASNQ